MCSSCSGIGCVHESAGMLEGACRKIANGPKFSCRVPYVCEPNSQYLDYLVSRLGPKHAFKDIASWLPPDVLADVNEHIASSPEPYHHVRDLIMNCKLQARAPCMIHVYSACRRPKVDADETSTVCKDYSIRNLSRKQRNGSFCSVILTWLKCHIDDQTPVLVHENVEDFDWKIIVEELEPLGWKIIFSRTVSQLSLARMVCGELGDLTWRFAQSTESPLSETSRTQPTCRIDV